MIKLVVTDLDNTLLHRDKSVSPFTLDVLKRCQQQGVQVAIATGRPCRFTQQYRELIAADIMICQNGSVVDIAEKRIQRCGIKPEVTRDVMLALTKMFPDGMLSVEIDDVLYANFDVNLVWAMTEAVESDFTDLPDKLADKIIVSIEQAEDVSRIATLLTDDLYLEIVNEKLCAILNKDADKMQGIAFIAEHLGITIAEVAAFGDEVNDVTMLQGCGFGVAVSNAIPQAKEAAAYICGDCDADGLAHWLVEHVLEGI